MSNVQCPACLAQLGIPVGASRNAVVQCPGCDAEFVLGDGETAELPLVVVVNDPTPEPLPSLDERMPAAVGAAVDAAEETHDAADTDGSESAFAVEEQAVGTASGDDAASGFDMLEDQGDKIGEDKDREGQDGEGKAHGSSAAESATAKNQADEMSTLDGLGAAIDLADKAVGAAAPSFEFGGTPSAESTSFGVSTGGPTRSPAREKKQKNGAVEVFKIVGGGIAGLTIAQLILWWLPGGLKRDPFGLAPSVASVVPFLVPTNYHPAPSNNRQRPPDPAGNRRPAPQHNDPIPTFESDLPDQEGLPDSGFGGTTINGNGGSASTDDAEYAQPEGGEVDSTDPKFDDPPIGVINPPTYASAELGGSLTASNLAFQQLLDFDGTGTPEEKAAKKDFYNQFCDLALKVTFVDPSGLGVQGRVDAVHRLLEEVGKHPHQVKFVGEVAAIWHALEERPSDGILLAGTVAGINRSGSLYESTIILQDDAATVVTVLSTVDPTDNPISTYHPGSSVLVLGSVVDTPADSLSGYDGPEPVVIWGGYPVELAGP